MFKSRSNKLELLDNDDIPTQDLYQNLRELDFINTYLSGHSVVLEGVRYFENTIKNKISDNSENINIYEIGSGGGDNLREISKFLEKRNIQSKLIGIDLKADCVEFAEKFNKNNLISYQTTDYRHASFLEAKPDIIYNSLFCHHFKDDDLVSMLQWMYQEAELGFFICDLHRHPVAYYAIKMLTSIFSGSYLVKNDAPLSVLRGFSKREWIILLEKANIKNYKISWKWAFRWLIVVEKI